ncbi:MAG: hypothetical protein NT129_05545 [Candidatus Aenigmarchaeota archaeon]|nr:hypothetical protein [Candidatus Aenigmarchaeota archaeon]
MSLFGPFVYKTKDDKKFWLHMKQMGKVTLYFFSNNPANAISMPRGYEVVENPRISLPFLKKREGGLFGKKKEEKKVEKAEATVENPQQ